MAESEKTEVGAREGVVRQLKVERDRLQARIETMYLDRLDGRITAEFFAQKSKEWREQQKGIEAQIAQIGSSDLGAKPCKSCRMSATLAAHSVRLNRSNNGHWPWL